MHITTTDLTERQPERLVRIREVKELTGLSTSYIYALVADERFPRSVQILEGGVAKAWVLSEVTSWITQRIAARDQRGNAC